MPTSFEKYLTDWLGTSLWECKTLPQAGSSRQYYRVEASNKNYILTVGDDLLENETFIAIANWFNNNNCNAPKVLFSNNEQVYLQEDLGSESLYGIVKKDGFSDSTIQQYQLVIDELINWQSKSHKKFNWQLCQPIKKFSEQAFKWDFNYFKYYFAKISTISYDEGRLEKDFNTLAEYLMQADGNYFVIRDFQSRNIIFKDNRPYFIDFQGGRKGAAQYDLASLLFQASVNMPNTLRQQLLDYYIKQAQTQLAISSDFKAFYYAFVWARQLQVLGAYGFRGLYEGKSYFTKSIPLAIKNIEWLISNNLITIELPELTAFFKQLIDCEWHKQFEYTLDEKKLTVSINSFSYKKGGIPKDLSDNGGGFVFDCRGLPNPHRIETIRPFNGTQQPVIEYLEKQDKAQKFFSNMCALVEPSIENYIERKFTHLQINFGCTGGKHRSVFNAQKLYAYLGEKYDINLKLNHIEQEITATNKA